MSGDVDYCQLNSVQCFGMCLVQGGDFDVAWLFGPVSCHRRLRAVSLDCVEYVWFFVRVPLMICVVQEMADEMRSLGGQRMIDGAVIASTVLNLMASSMGTTTYLLAGTGNRTKITANFVNLLFLPSGECCS